MHLPSLVFHQVMQKHYSGEVGKSVFIAQSFSNAFAKNYENHITLDRVTAKNVADRFCDTV